MSQKFLEFHIKANDCFGILATILSLISQNIEKNKSRSLNLKVLKSIPLIGFQPDKMGSTPVGVTL